MLTQHKFDSRRLLVIPRDPEKTILWATHHFIECAKQAIKTHGRCIVVLSGDSPTQSDLPEALPAPLFRRHRLEQGSFLSRHQLANSVVCILHWLYSISDNDF